MTKHCKTCGVELPKHWRGPQTCEMCRSLDDINREADYSTDQPLDLAIEQRIASVRAEIEQWEAMYRAWLRIRKAQ